MNNEQTTDYGEPWQPMGDDEIWSDNEDEGTLAVANGCIRERIIASVNACAGMADPAAEIASMREAIREARKVLLANEFNSGINGTLCQVCFSHFSKGHKGNCAFAAAIAKLQPFIK